MACRSKATGVGVLTDLWYGGYNGWCMVEKLCCRCKTTKPVDEFNRQRTTKDGLGSYCRECNRDYLRAWMGKGNGRAVRDASRGPIPKLASPGRSPRVTRVDCLSYRARVRTAVAAAIRDGELVRPSACSSCGASGCRIVGHHPDYAKPFDVVWLCDRCHHRAHNVVKVPLEVPCA